MSWWMYLGTCAGWRVLVPWRLGVFFQVRGGISRSRWVASCLVGFATSETWEVKLQLPIYFPPVFFFLTQKHTKRQRWWSFIPRRGTPVQQAKAGMLRQGLTVEKTSWKPNLTLVLVGKKSDIRGQLKSIPGMYLNMICCYLLHNYNKFREFFFLSSKVSWFQALSFPDQLRRPNTPSISGFNKNDGAMFVTWPRTSKIGLSKTRGISRNSGSVGTRFLGPFFGITKKNHVILFVVQWELVISTGLFRKANCVSKYPSTNFNDQIDLLEIRRRLASERCAARETTRWLAIPCLWSPCPKATELQTRCWA